jgi:hypothetical protein
LKPAIRGLFNGSQSYPAGRSQLAMTHYQDLLAGILCGAIEKASEGNLGHGPVASGIVSNRVARGTL